MAINDFFFVLQIRASAYLYLHISKRTRKGIFSFYLKQQIEEKKPSLNEITITKDSWQRLYNIGVLEDN